MTDRAMAETLDAVLAEAASLASQVDALAAESRSKAVQVTLLSEVGRALQSTMQLDDLLLVILTAVTAGDGLGFNRAILLLVDEEGALIRGRLGVGPADPDEADRIWKAMEKENMGLADTLSARWPDGKAKNGAVTELARRIVLPMDPETNAVAACLESCTSFIARDEGKAPLSRVLAHALGNEDFVVVPLVAEGRKLGAILADNFVTGRMIDVPDVQLLETFASQAALAILNASLHEKLRRRLRQLEEAYDELSSKHLQILRAETQVALGGLAGTLVHDLRAPLVSIGLMARRAASDAEDGRPVAGTLKQIAAKVLETEQYLEELARSARRKARQAEPVEIKGLVSDALGLLRGLMTSLGVDAVTELDHGDLCASGSRVEYRQLFLNLLQNALEAMPDGGTLTVRTRPGELSRGGPHKGRTGTEQPGGGQSGRDKPARRHPGIEKTPAIVVSVADTGTGLSESARKKMFSAFFTTKEGGSGLGLLSVKRIISDWGGHIDFESEEGSGTCFTIKLPVWKQPIEADETSRTQIA
jgi:signal transduction histidine kinase